MPTDTTPQFGPTQIIATYAAILSTGQLVYTILRNWREDEEKKLLRARLEPSLAFRLRFEPGGIIRGNLIERYIVRGTYTASVEVVNTGGSDIVLNDARIKGSNSAFRGLPKLLKPTGHAKFNLGPAGDVPFPITFVVTDNTGKKWSDTLDREQK